MFYYISKIFWIFFNPFNFLILLLLIGLILHFLKKKIYKKIYLITLSLLIITSILPTGYYLIWKLENSYSLPNIPDNIDGMLILSNGIDVKRTYEHNQLILNGKIERLIEPVKLIKKFPNATIIISGNNDTFGKFTSVNLTKNLYGKFGIQSSKIIFEDKSRNTYENIYFSKKLIDSKNWLLITSAIHMKRAIYVAEKLEMNFIPYPVDFTKTKNFSFKNFYRRNNYLLNMQDFQSASYEIIGLIAYYLTGKSSKIY